MIIWAFVFILGLQCGLQGAYFNRSIGAPSLAGLFSAYCDLREGLPYAFGYILSAKVGTGIVAELGAMRISDEIDALEVMGIPPVTFLCRDPPARRLDRDPLPLPGRDRGRLLRQLHRGGPAGRRRLLGRLPADLLDVPETRPTCFFSLIKGMVMATAIVLVGCYYGYTASGGPVGVGTATAQSMVVNIILVHIIGMLGTVVFWGSNPRAPIGG